MKKLIPIGQRNLDLSINRISGLDTSEFYRKKSLQYTMFCYIELNIGMFIPAKYKNGKWVILEKPVNYSTFLNYPEENMNLMLKGGKCIEYQEAEQNVLFEGWVNIKYFGNRFLQIENTNCKVLQWDNDEQNFFMHSGFKIEDLIKYNFPLTKQGEELSGL